MRKYQAFAVIRISQSIIQQIPVQAIHPAIIGMTARTGLPLLEAISRIMKQDFTQSYGINFHLRIQ